MEEFICFLKEITPLQKESCDAFISKCRTFSFTKGQQLVKAGQTSQYLYYMKSGIGKVYYLKDGKEIIDCFCEEGSLFTSVSSFLNHKPSLHTLTLIEDSELIGISYTDLEELYSKFHDLERLGRQLTTLALVKLQDRINSMQFETAEKRYQNYLTKAPNYYDRISLGDLASYLGMTQVTLSRIRAKKDFFNNGKKKSDL